MTPTKPKNLESIYQLSPVQEGILFHSLYEPTEGLYFLQLGFTLRGALNIAVLKQAWGEVFARHAVLRTGFEWEGLEKPAQVVYRHVPLPFEELDWRHLDVGPRQAAFEELLRRDQARGFELRKAPLVRLTLARGVADLHYFVWSFHHLLVDGWCLPLIFEEVFTLYSSLLKGRSVRLPPARPYREFIGWLRGQDLGPAEEFWRAYLAGIEGPTALPLAEVDPEAPPGHEVRNLLVPAERLETFARRHRVTVNTLVQGAWALLLARFANRSEAIFGATSSGRSAPIPGIQKMIGLFINTLPVRLRTPAGARLGPWLQEIQAAQATLRQHEFTPLVKVQTWSGQGGGQSLFEAILVFENYPMGEAVDQLRGEVDLEIDMVRNPEAINYPLALIVFEGEQLDLRLNYERRHFSVATIDRLLAHLRWLLEAMVEDPQRPLAALPLFSPAEREQLIARSRRVRAAPLEVASLPRLFAAQAARWPERVAVLCGQEQLTYGELDRRSSALAGRLSASGVGPEDRVGLFAPRGLGLPLGILGILKAGAVYVPLDPKAPAARISYILEDAQVRVVVASDEASGPPVHGGETVCLEGAIEQPEVAPVPPEAARSADHAAYVMYTSGSTGQPKGVVVSHGNVARLFAATEEALALSEEDVWTLFHSFAFDVSVYELWGALLFGGRLVVVPRWTLVSPEEFCDLLTEQRVTVLSQTPSAFRSLIPVATARGASSSSLRLVLFAGEMLDFGMLPPWFNVFGERRPRLINLYGITETTVYVTVREVVECDLALGRSAVGPPMVDLDLFVLDHRLEIVAPGVIGEICVGGPGLARCYLAQPRQTAVRFVPNPFAVEPGARLYRSGDLGRWFGDADLEVLGRMDQQVKIRGFRIELGEVEAALRALPGIADGVVLVREEAVGSSLVAYVVPEEKVSEAATGSATGSVEGFRRGLARSLPDYMIPGVFVTLAELPLTLNGKLDRKALAKLSPAEAAPAAVKPRGAVEEILAGIWSEVLEGGKSPGAFDNFFALGGHSLLVTRVISRIRSILGVEVPIKDFFEAPTLAGLAARVEDGQRQDALRQGGSVAFPPLVPRSTDEELELSFAQERLWLEDQLGAGASYNMPLAVRLRGRLAPAVLGESFSEIVRRHEVLRTLFVARDGKPRGVVGCPTRVSLPTIDLRALPVPVRCTESDRLMAREAAQPFDLARGPLIRFTLLYLNGEETVLLLTMHHIVSDGWSMEVLIKEFSALYGAFVRGDASVLPELVVQYSDFAHWQRQWLREEVLEAQLDYWRERLAGVPVLELPTDRPRPAFLSSRGGSLPVVLNKWLGAALGALARAESSTLFMTLLTAFVALLARYTGQEDVTVGSPIAGRNRLEVEGLIGFFVNTLVLRTDLAMPGKGGGASFRSVLAQVREMTLDAYVHQDLPFEKLVAELQPERDFSTTPLFQVMFVLQNPSAGAPEIPELVLEPLPVNSGMARFELTLLLSEVEEGFVGTLEYMRDLFDQETFQRFWYHFERLLEGIVAAPDQRLADLPLLSASEKHQLLVEWNPRQVDEITALGVHELFASQAEHWADAVALVVEDVVLSYRELDRRANQLAHRLRRMGVGPEVPVGILLGRGASLVIATLAVIKAGGAYVPLDPNYPQDRLHFVLEDTGAPVLLTASAWLKSCPSGGAEILCLDQTGADLIGAAETPLPVPTLSDHTVYIIYTSGSTGRPKGVVISHRQFMTLLRWSRGYLPPKEEFRVLETLSPSFDFGAFELLNTLIWGGTLCIPRLEVWSDPRSYAQAIARYAITVIHSTPTFLQEMVAGGARFDSVKILHLGGEALNRDQVDRFFAAVGEGCALINGYGPTEATVTTSIFAVGQKKKRWDNGYLNTPIGRVAANNRVYVVDRQGLPVLTRVSGELWIGGAGVARGYLNRPRQTADKFIPDALSGEVGGRIYRTGDLARFLPNGYLEFLGRLDHQVKLRGLRVELGEIEVALGQYPGVREVAVVAREEKPGDQRLVAFWVGDPEGPSPEELRSAISQRLPSYMVPSFFVVLEALPRLPNGKVNRSVLARWELSAERGSPKTVDGTATPVEELLAGIWCEVLGLTHVGPDEDFFSLGGHSLLATQVMSRVRDTFGVELALRRFFEASTVSALAREVWAARAEGQVSDAPPMVALPRTGDLPLSFAQERFWFEDQLGAGARYNMPVAVRLLGRLEPAAAADSISEIVRRHEVLRTVCPARDGAPYGRAAPPAAVPLPTVDLRALPAAAGRGASERLLAREMMRPFDLAVGPLLRCLLLRLAAEEHVLFFNQHHVISDAWSLGILVEEFGALYAARVAGRPSPLPELSVQYADYAHWQRRFLRGEVLERQLTYWQERFAVEPPPLDISAASDSLDSAKDQGGQRVLPMPKELADALGALSRRQGATLFMTLLAGFFALLYRETGSQDLTVGSAVAGRDRLESEGLIGCFINLLALRVEFEGGLRFCELLDRVREVALEAYAHQELPFERLVEELSQGRGRSWSPVQIAFGLQNAPTNALELPGLKVEAVELNSLVARLDLTVWVLESQDGLQISWTWRRSLYSDVAIERLHWRFTRLLDSATENPKIRIDALQLAPQGTAEEGAAEQVRSKSFTKFRRKAGRRSAVPG